MQLKMLDRRLEKENIIKKSSLSLGKRSLYYNGAGAQDIINKFWNKEEKRATLNFEVETEESKIEVSFSGGVAEFKPG